MKPTQIMLIAGEASGDALAAELVRELRAQWTAAPMPTADLQPLHTALAPRFFGAGGPRMAAAGVELAFDLTEQAIIGIPSPKNYLNGRRRFRALLRMALDRQPDVIIGVDYNYFNLSFAHAIRRHAGARGGWFHNWRPKLVKFISPQVWASREGRARQIVRDFDLLLSIFPFEKEWYARRVPKLRVESVGHPLLDRIPSLLKSERGAVGEPSRVLLLPASRTAELKRHLPVMLGALDLIRRELPAVHARIVLPTERLAHLAKQLAPAAQCELQVGRLHEALAAADLAISKTGTVSMECALFGVPAITLYKTSWLTFEYARRVVKVSSLTMPNLLAGEAVFPEFIQNAATPEAVAVAALELLRDPVRRAKIQARLAIIAASLGGPGATRRAARAIRELL